jgi:hypothetical protein
MLLIGAGVGGTFHSQLASFPRRREPIVHREGFHFVCCEWLAWSESNFSNDLA